jgi:hypothetical protein
MADTGAFCWQLHAEANTPRLFTMLLRATTAGLMSLSAADA